MAIPKKIHWCWLSGDPIPQNLQKCINSWKRIMPDYEIVCWDMKRFDIHSLKFVEDACKHRKWAFAADYIRLYALYTEGGIYLDSDVMVFRRFDKFLYHAAFSSVEYIPEFIPFRKEDNYIGYAIQAAIIGAESGNGWIKMCLEHYQQNKKFKMKKGGLVDVEVIPNILARYAHNYYGFQYDKPFDIPQYLKENIVIYQPKVFTATCGMADMHTYALHIGEGSWGDDTYKQHRRAESFIRKFYRMLCINYRFVAMLHYKRTQLFKIKKPFSENY
ncbi:Mannosyltransferase OCH1 [Bacteroidales bacterium Barb6]|nr:Mannosyltransferase OCH1 [Bacteroidales bacterium Barb6]